jgi:hypothetical protein
MGLGAVSFCPRAGYFFCFFIGFQSGGVLVGFGGFLSNLSATHTKHIIHTRSPGDPHTHTHTRSHIFFVHDIVIEINAMQDLTGKFRTGVSFL